MLKHSIHLNFGKKKKDAVTYLLGFVPQGTCDKRLKVGSWAEGDLRVYIYAVDRSLVFPCGAK